MRTFVVPLLLILGSVGYESPVSYDFHVRGRGIVSRQVVVRIERDTIVAMSGERIPVADVYRVEVSGSDNRGAQTMLGVLTGGVVGSFVGCLTTPVSCEIGPQSSSGKSASGACRQAAVTGGIGGALVGGLLGYLTASGPEAIDLKSEDVETKRTALEAFFAAHSTQVGGE